jgi:acetyltransferase-like isoleucine patch superfamily enzyme
MWLSGKVFHSAGLAATTDARTRGAKVTVGQGVWLGAGFTLLAK